MRGYREEFAHRKTVRVLTQTTFLMNTISKTLERSKWDGEAKVFQT